MARLHLHPDRLEIALSTAEKTLALRKDNIVIPRSAIRSATLTDDPWIWVRGIRAPGTAIPLTLAVGQWKFHGGKDFLVLKGTKPSVVIDIADEEFSRVIVTTKHGLELVANLQLDVKPAKKTARARKATPQVTPKPKRVLKQVTDADAPATSDGSVPTEGLAVVTPETAVAAAKARAPRRTRANSAADTVAVANSSDEITAKRAKSPRPPAPKTPRTPKASEPGSTKQPRTPKSPPVESDQTTAEPTTETTDTL